MLKKIVLHIGQTKTASTSLQMFLTGNKEFIFKNGVTYFRFPNSAKEISHRYIFNLLMYKTAENDEEKAYYNRLLQRSFPNIPSSVENHSEQFLIDSIKNCSTETGLLSEELLWHLGGFDNTRRCCCLSHLKEIILKAVPLVKIKVIAYLRPQDSWLESWHNQLVKDDCVQIPIQSLLSRHLRLAAYDYSQIIDDWMQILKPEKMVLRPFTPDGLLNNSIYDDCIVEALDLTPTSNYWLPKKKFQLSLHPAVCAFTVRNHPIIEGGYKKALIEMSNIAREYRPFKGIDFTLLEDEDRRRLEQETTVLNKKLSTDYNFTHSLSDYFTWKKTVVPTPLPWRIRRKFHKILG
ncbi:MAG: hypothetical protein GY705_21590 [Bacteroidetes bacterium]|nr:hypothetical protein [Bacteroidota bacterium]